MICGRLFWAHFPAEHRKPNIGDPMEAVRHHASAI